MKQGFVPVLLLLFPNRKKDTPNFLLILRSDYLKQEVLELPRRL